MRKTGWLRGVRALSATALMAITVASCGESVDLPDTLSPQAERVDAIKVTLGTQNMTIFKDGKITLGPLVLVRPSAAIVATLIDENDQVIAATDLKDVQVNMGRENGSTALGITFTRTSDFGGTLAATTAGNSSFTISLFDKVNRRIAFGPYTVALVVR